MTVRGLLDTHTLLFWRAGGSPMGRRARAALLSPDAELYFSVCSIWEISIKRGLGKLVLPATTEEFVSGAVTAGVRILDVRPTHVYRSETLAWHHKDPFDRLLAAQALVEDLELIGKDRIFRKYGVRSVW